MTVAETTSRSPGTEQQTAELAPEFPAFLKGFRPYFATTNGVAHLAAYARGLSSDLPRKSVEPIALAAGCAVRTLQEFLTFHAGDQNAVRDKLQRRFVTRHMPAPGRGRPSRGHARRRRSPLDALGVIGLVDKTAAVKKGTKTPGVRFDWIVFDEYYGGKPGYLFGLDSLGLHGIGEVPKNFLCWPTRPAYHSPQAPFAPKRVDHTACWGKPFRKRPWRRFRMRHQTEGPALWRAKAGRVHLVKDGLPTGRKYWLIVAQNEKTGEVKYFVSNAPPQTSRKRLLRHGYISSLASSNIPVKALQQLARHGDPRLTLGVYSHLQVHDLVGALDALPRLAPTRPQSEAAAATGTDGTAYVSDDHQQKRQHLAQAAGPKDASGCESPRIGGFEETARSPQEL